MLTVALENLLVGAAGLALLFYMGGGLTRLLPSGLAPYRWFIAPWAGYSLLVITTQFLTNEPFALTSVQSAFVALGLGTLFWVLDFGFWKGRESGIGNRELGGRWVFLITVCVFVLCILPLWSYGYTTVIGENWDVEVYLGLGEYLKSYPQSGLAAALPNPILDTLVNPPYSLRTHGFSYFQAGLGMLPLDSLHTLAPMLALLRALSIPAAYVFFRVGLGLRSGAALAACAALGLNGFLLWITYNMFGMQVPTFGLLPLALAGALLMLGVGGQESGDGNREPETDGVAAQVPPPASHLPASIWTALFAAALAITYHPALTAFVALAGPVLLVALARRGRKGAARRILLDVGVAAIAAFALSFVAQWKSLGGFLKQYGEKTGGLGLTGFTSPGDALGLSLSFRDLLPTDLGRPLVLLLTRVYGAAGWIALLLSLALVVVYVYSLFARGDRWRAWVVGAFVAGAGAYSVAFLWPLNYPYGWFKSLAFVSFVFVGAAAGGLWSLFDLTQKRNFASNKVLRLSMALGGLFLLGLAAFTSVLTVARYWGQPLRYDRSMVEAGAVRWAIVEAKSRGASVYISNSPNMQPLGRLFNGLLSYYLRDTDLYGSFDTANSQLDRERSDGLYRYELLHADDDPAEYGVSNARLAWHNSLLSLYEAPPESQRPDLYHHNYRGERAYPEIIVDAPLYAVPMSRTLDLGRESPATAGPLASPRQVTLGLAALTTTTLHIDLLNASAPASSTDVVVPPGYSIYRTVPMTGNMALALTTVHQGDEGGKESIYVRWAHMEEYRRAPGQESGLSAGGPGLLARVSSTQFGPYIATTVGYMNNRPGAISQTLSLDIYGAGAGGQGKHFGYWNIDVPTGVPLSMSMQLDPVDKLLKFYGPPTLNNEDRFVGNTGDGAYTASLLLYEHGHVAATFNDIFTFEIKGGALASFKPRNLPPQFR
jgi:hypothetical protein